jgi:uncharacterized protein YkwD
MSKVSSIRAVFGLFGFTLAGILMAAALATSAHADVSTREAARAAAAVSAWRAAHGLPPVASDATLSKLAAQQTAAMMARGWISHDAGGEFQARVRAGGVRGLAAENLAFGSATLDHTMALWQGSSGHNANLLNPAIRRVGLARGVTPTGQVYWTMVLAGR